MSGDHSVGAIGPIFDSSAQQVGSQDTHCRRATGREALLNIHLGGRHCALCCVCQNPTHAPEGKKVKFNYRLCGDAMVVHLKREIPEIMATR